MNPKKYDGYRAYQYLDPEDLPKVEFVEQINRVPSRQVETTDEQEARVRRIFEENLIISLHDHCFVSPKDLSNFLDFRRSGREFTAYEGLAVSGLDCVFDAMMDGTAMITSRAGWKWDDVVFDIGMRLSDIAHQDMVQLALTTEDIRRCKREGKIAFVISLEGAAMIENELDRIDVLYGLGMRSLGIAYSEGNALGAGLKEPAHYGLTEFGKRAVKRMNQLGVAIDISHSSDQTSLDTIEVSEHPVFITHAGARALWDTPRLKPDNVIKACAEKGGVIGIEAAPHTTITRNNLEHSIDSFMEHFEYCADLVGIDHVAFGPDTLFGDHVALHQTLRDALSLGASKGKAPYPEVEYVDGIENPAEAFPNIVRWLVTHGYSDDEIGKVLGGNIMRVLDQVWAR